MNPLTSIIISDKHGQKSCDTEIMFFVCEWSGIVCDFCQLVKSDKNHTSCIYYMFMLRLSSVNGKYVTNGKVTTGACVCVCVCVCVCLLYFLLSVSGQKKGQPWLELEVYVNMKCDLVEMLAANLIITAKGASILASINH